jgi:hypothetical protein
MWALAFGQHEDRAARLSCSPLAATDARGDHAGTRSSWFEMVLVILHMWS